MNKTVVLKDTKYHEETKQLSQDAILIQMAKEIPNDWTVEQISFSSINSEYKKRGGKADPQTIGSLKEALKHIRGES